MKYLFEEKQLLEKSTHMYPLFSNDLSPTHSESVWTNGINYGYYICDVLAGGDYLKVKERVGNWNKFRDKFLKVRKKNTHKFSRGHDALSPEKVRGGVV